MSEAGGMKRAVGSVLAGGLLVALTVMLTVPVAAASPTTRAHGPPHKASRPSVTGFGATDAVWNAHHRVDPRFRHHAAYKPRVRGSQDKYTAVYHGKGHVLFYNVSMPRHTTEAQALAIVLKEFPADAVATPIVRQTDSRGNTCAWTNVASATLGRQLAHTPSIGDPQGEVGVGLLTEGRGSAITYNPRNVTSAYLSLSLRDAHSGC